MIVDRGGSGNIAGVFLGAFLVVGLPEVSRDLSGARMLFYGLAMMFMMIYRTQGILPPRPRIYRLDRAGGES